ncbi:MAG: alkaline phosphatase family protein [Actinomycetales bacterium]|nr:alkaline phosphatase family protein [Actinomycetales bacterium]
MSRARTWPKRAAALVACLLVAGTAYTWATALMDSLYDFRAPLTATVADASTSPKPTPPNPALARKVVMVLVDGLRVDTATNAAVMPFLTQLRAQGASTTVHSRTPSYSVPSWTVLLTGAWPDRHGAPVMNPTDPQTSPPWPIDNLFAAARDAGRRTGLAGTDWFRPLVPPAALSVTHFVHEETDAADQESTDAAVAMLRGDAADLVLLHLNEVDHAGHYGGGGTSVAWLDAARKVDARLAQVAAALDLSRDALLVVSDHGHLDQGGHGGPEDVVVTEPLVLVGSGVRPGVAPDIAQADVAPTLAVLAGTRVLQAAQGEAALAMLTLDDTARSALGKAQVSQQDLLIERYQADLGNVPLTTAVLASGEGVEPVRSATTAGRDAATQVRETRLGWERANRAATLILLGLVAVTSLALWVRRDRSTVLWAFAGAAAYLVVWQAYWKVSGKTYSLSSVMSAGEIVNATAMATAVALFAALAVMWRGRRPERGDRAWAVWCLGVAVATVLAMPIAFYAWAWGPTATWTVPDPLPMYLAFSALVQLLVVAVLTPLGAMVAGLVSRGRTSSQPTVNASAVRPGWTKA